jgi:hypothetical protein
MSKTFLIGWEKGIVFKFEVLTKVQDQILELVEQ